MVGVIWLVQLVHYPVFEFLDRATFARCHAYHSSAISVVVMPGMLIELALASLMLFKRADLPAFIGLALLILIWGMTFLVMIPLHTKLGSEGYHLQLIQSLVQWNWLRTIAWTARGFLAAFWL